MQFGQICIARDVVRAYLIICPVKYYSWTYLICAPDKNNRDTGDVNYPDKKAAQPSFAQIKQCVKWFNYLCSESPMATDNVNGDTVGCFGLERLVALTSLQPMSLDLSKQANMLPQQGIERLAVQTGIPANCYVSLNWIL